MKPTTRIFLAVLCLGLGLHFWRDPGMIWQPERRVPPEALPQTCGPSMNQAKAVLPMKNDASYPAMAGFESWAERYLAADVQARLELEAEGVALARERRPVFKQLIETNPEAALQNAVPMVVRQELPPAVLAQLEERVADRGVLRNYWREPGAGADEPPVLRYAELENGQTLRAHVYGRRAQAVGWTMNASLNGVALDGQFAVHESPLRVLEIGERPDPAKKAVEMCPISGIKTAAAAADTPITQVNPAVEVYGEIVYLCDGSHTTLYEQSLIYGESSSGGAQGFTGILPSAPTPSVGVVKVLCITAVFADQGQVPASEATMHNMLRETGDFYQVTSFGRLTLQATVTPTIVLPRNQAWYNGKDTTSGYVLEIDGLGIEMTHAKEEARKLGFDWQDYHCTVLRSFGGARSPTSYGGGGNVWMRTDSTSVCSHEIGHAFGLAHANFWQTNGASVIGPGGNVEYGDIYDNMGSTSPPAGHWNVQAKNQIKWLPNEFVPPIQRSGTYRVYAFDTPRLEPGKMYGLRIPKDQERTYWAEYRTLFTSNNWASNGLLLGWKWPANSGGNLQLLDTTPGSPNDRSDAAITLGRTFSDFEAGIHLTTLAVNPTTVPPSLDVQVNLGSFAGNQPPAVTLAASGTVVPTNTPVTFTATASDPDGDALSYGWIWHDSTISPNAPEVTRTFTTSGIYTLNCVVSDMKGGTTIRNAVITVGSGNNRFTISGRITREGQGLGGINVTTSGTNGTLTDSEGYFTISNLAAGTYTVTPAVHGLTFNEQFNNNVTVGPSFNGAVFTADALPVVSITAPVPLAHEGGEGGVFRITRTGSTALPLVVYVFSAQGTAVLNTDYTFSPGYISASPWQTFTIPEEASFLDVAVNAVNDTAQEGYETVRLVLGQDTSFAPGDSISATVGIVDDDTPRPRVSLTADELQVIERAGVPVVCKVTRTGSTQAALDVPYAVAATSTAASGADYVALPGVVTIPAGADSATFEIIPVDDSLAEETEQVRVSITTNAAFMADVSASSLVATLVDDDTQVVTVSTSDATASEVDLSVPGAVPDVGVFMLTRSGDVSAPLKTYYSVAGTALHGADYEALAGVVEFPAGETRAAVIIQPIFDGFGESPETVVLSLAAGNGNYLLGDVFQGTVTLQDTASPPVLEVMASSAIAAEPSSNGTFRITAKGTGTGTVTVRYAVSGTAVAGADYNITGLNTTTLEGSTTVTLNNGTVTRDLTVTVINDTAFEELETVVLTLLPDPAYSLWAPRASSTLLLRDNEQPTVFVDGQIGTGSAHVIAESATSTVCKFWISRTGGTASALVVNYSMVGTATNGVDHTALSGTATIPAGAPGVDVSFNVINDTLFEGTETVILRLEPGAYARGSEGIIYIADNEGGGPSVAFSESGGAGVESSSPVQIPVRLTEPADVPVTVEYSLEGGTRIPTMVSGFWLRIVKTGNAFESFLSRDGVDFAKVGTTRNFTSFATSYLAGIAFTSATSGTNASLELDQLSITGLSVGGALGTRASADLGSTSPPGGTVESGGLYQVSAGGPDFSQSSTTDGGRIVYFPVTNSANCTITARVRGISSTSANVKAGITLRETTAANARHFTYVTDSSHATRQILRVSAGGNATTSLISTTFPKPQWLRMQRVGNVFRTFTSMDGVTFVPFGVSELPLASKLLVGLAASARSDGLLTQAEFDNILLVPPSDEPLQGRVVGFVNEPGVITDTAGGVIITASGAGIMPSSGSTEDEGHFYSAALSGDFTLTARLASISGGASNAQAGIMVRESVNYRARALWFGLTGSASSGAEFRARASATSSGEGGGVDYSLAPGVLTFAPGEVEKTIALHVTDDAVPEPNESVAVLLKNAHRAVLGAPSVYTYTIVDDDGPITPQPVIGFAGSTSSGFENSSPAFLPVVLSRSSSSVISIQYATHTEGTAIQGEDYTPVSGTLVFAPGETVKLIELPVLNDEQAEPTKTVVLGLSAVQGALLSTTSTHVFTLLDDDVPVVTVAASTPEIVEGGSAGVFTFARTGATDEPLTVQFTRSGTASLNTDFVAFSPATSITFPAGAASVTLAVVTVQNTTPEVDETLILTLAGGSGYVVGNPAVATMILKDDDVNTITLVASDASASESGLDPGALTLMRTGPLTATRSVTLSITGNATSNADYVSFGTSHTFAIGQDTLVIPVTILQDSLTEGTEQIVVSIATSTSYIIGNPSVASISILDDDLPPTVFIGSPAAKSPVIAAGNGLLLNAVSDDDGLPQVLSHTWSQLFGPAQAVFENASAAQTAVTFPASGVYGLRITVDDGQFTATDDLFVQAGGFAYAEWVSQDQGPPSVRGVAGVSQGMYTVIGSGTGYTSANDSGHMLFRQLLGGDGTATLTARLTGLTGPSTRLAGITLRDTSWKGARRVNLLVDGAGNVQVRTRSSANSADSAVTTSGFTTPLWLRLTRAEGSITAYTAPDVDGLPGAWTQRGTASAVTMGENIIVGLLASSGSSTTATSTAIFDNITVTPGFSGPALHSEDIGNYTLPGSSSVDGAITTVNAVGTYDGTGGHFRYQQIWGDCIITARLLSQTGNTRGSQAGVGIRDTTDNGAHGFYGRTSVDGFQVHWRSTPGGSGGTLQTGGSIMNWVRLIRKGNALSAFRAADSGGSPGAWTQVSGNLPASLTGPLLVGLVVDSNSSSLTGTGTFSGLTIEPLNTAPVVQAGSVPEMPAFVLQGTVVDDGRPSPPGAFSVEWSKVSGPGGAIFSDAQSLNPLLTLAQSGTHKLRLAADDGDVRTFADTTFTAFLTHYDKWRHENFSSGLLNPQAELLADSDHDSWVNLLEYAFNLQPGMADADPVLRDFVVMGSERYLRLSVSKNSTDPSLIYEVQASSNLLAPESWSSAGLIIEENSATTLRVRDYVPSAPGVRRFMRVRVSFSPP